MVSMITGRNNVDSVKRGRRFCNIVVEGDLSVCIVLALAFATSLALALTYSLAVGCIASLLLSCVGVFTAATSLSFD